MKKFSINSPCPCGSGAKYKKCCQKYHKGALVKDALTLMKSRYSAYALSEADYIIKTTDSQNVDFTNDLKAWRESILEFSNSNDFEGLKIIEYIDNGDSAIVEFEAYISGGIMRERSSFIKRDSRWLYVEAL